MDPALIVALIAAIAAIVSPVVTQLISIRGSFRLKTVELFFNAKAEAFQNLLEVTSKYHPNPCPELLMQLESAMNQAFLYSSKGTQQKLALYIKLLKEFPNCDPGSYANASVEAILAMQSELQECRK